METEAELLAAPVRFSRLKLMARSPAHYRYGYKEPTRPMELGTAVDSLLFTGQMLACYPGATRRGKEYDAFVAANPGALVLNKSTYDQAKAMVDVVLAHPTAATMLAQGVKQERIEWVRNGRKCAGTPDIIDRANNRIIDFKTANDGNPETFKWAALRMAYHGQLAFYRSGAGMLGGECYIIVQESKPPYPVSVMRVSEPLLEQGDRMCALWLERVLACEASSSWPGYAQSIVELEAPTEDEVPLVFEDEDEVKTEAA